jgi:hypothetical protein
MSLEGAIYGKFWKVQNFFVKLLIIMNNELKNKIAELKAQLKRGDMARIVDAVESKGIQRHDVYNIMNGKSLNDHQKLVLVLQAVNKCIKDNKRYLLQLESEVAGDS